RPPVLSLTALHALVAGRRRLLPQPEPPQRREDRSHQAPPLPGEELRRGRLLFRGDRPRRIAQDRIPDLTGHLSLLLAQQARARDRADEPPAAGGIMKALAYSVFRHPSAQPFEWRAFVRGLCF